MADKIRTLSYDCRGALPRDADGSWYTPGNIFLSLSEDQRTLEVTVESMGIYYYGRDIPLPGGTVDIFVPQDPFSATSPVLIFPVGTAGRSLAAYTQQLCRPPDLTPGLERALALHQEDLTVIAGTADPRQLLATLQQLREEARSRDMLPLVVIRERAERTRGLDRAVALHRTDLESIAGTLDPQALRIAWEKIVTQARTANELPIVILQGHVARARRFAAALHMYKDELEIIADTGHPLVLRQTYETLREQARREARVPAALIQTLAAEKTAAARRVADAERAEALRRATGIQPGEEPSRTPFPRRPLEEFAIRSTDDLPAAREQRVAEPMENSGVRAIVTDRERVAATTARVAAARAAVASLAAARKLAAEQKAAAIKLRAAAAIARAAERRATAHAAATARAAEKFAAREAATEKREATKVRAAEIAAERKAAALQQAEAARTAAATRKTAAAEKAAATQRLAAEQKAAAAEKIAATRKLATERKAAALQRTEAARALATERRAAARQRAATAKAAAEARRIATVQRAEAARTLVAERKAAATQKLAEVQRLAARRRAEATRKVIGLRAPEDSAARPLSRQLIVETAARATDTDTAPLTRRLPESTEAGLRAMATARAREEAARRTAEATRGAAAAQAAEKLAAQRATEARRLAAKIHATEIAAARKAAAEEKMAAARNMTAERKAADAQKLAEVQRLAARRRAEATRKAVGLRAPEIAAHRPLTRQSLVELAARVMDPATAPQIRRGPESTVAGTRAIVAERTRAAETARAAEAARIAAATRVAEKLAAAHAAAATRAAEKLAAQKAMTEKRTAATLRAAEAAAARKVAAAEKTANAQRIAAERKTAATQKVQTARTAAAARAAERKTAAAEKMRLAAVQRIAQARRAAEARAAERAARAAAAGVAGPARVAKAIGAVDLSRVVLPTGATLVGLEPNALVAKGYRIPWVVLRDPADPVAESQEDKKLPADERRQKHQQTRIAIFDAVMAQAMALVKAQGIAPADIQIFIAREGMEDDTNAAWESATRFQRVVPLDRFGRPEAPVVVNFDTAAELTRAEGTVTHPMGPLITIFLVPRHALSGDVRTPQATLIQQLITLYRAFLIDHHIQPGASFQDD